MPYLLRHLDSRMRVTETYLSMFSNFIIRVLLFKASILARDIK
jgi:hypothetical protein